MVSAMSHHWKVSKDLLLSQLLISLLDSLGPVPDRTVLGQPVQTQCRFAGQEVRTRGLSSTDLGSGHKPHLSGDFLLISPTGLRG